MRKSFWPGLLVALILLGLISPVSAQNNKWTDEQFKEKVNLSIDNGVKHLRSLQAADGSYPYGIWTNGSTALATWTLLESGVPKNDPAIQKGLKFLRTKLVNETTTYNISLAIILLDKYGDPRDVSLIEALAVRLFAGQNRDGGWTYRCVTSISSQEQGRILAFLRNPQAQPLIPNRKLSIAAAQQVQQIRIRNSNRTVDVRSDNSNTQFGMIALWISQKYGMPVTEAMNLVDQRFRRSQNPDGSWGYFENNNADDHNKGSAMTCAGLLGLALGHAVQPNFANKDLLSDKRVLDAFTKVYKILSDAGERDASYPQKVHYFLWSLERMAVAYNVRTVNGFDWYRWGANQLIEKDGEDGWKSGHKSGADTCFALLFLKRVNVAKDLTSKVTGEENPDDRGKEPDNTVKNKKPKKTKTDPFGDFRTPLVDPNTARTGPDTKKSDPKSTDPKKTDPGKPNKKPLFPKKKPLFPKKSSMLFELPQPNSIGLAHYRPLWIPTIQPMPAMRCRRPFIG